jgi:hypothetical protein
MKKLDFVELSDGRVIKPGDWLLHEFGVKQVMNDIYQYDNGIGPSVVLSDGNFDVSGSDILKGTRPLTLRNFTISRSFEWYYKS